MLPACEETIDTPTTRLHDRMHHFISLCDDEITLRKSEATAPRHLSPTGADIVPGRYEGGYKLWEGAIDLSEYLFRVHRQTRQESGETGNNDSVGALLRPDTRVLELGAGHALPCIVAARCGVRDLSVHDYNRDVLVDVTSANVHANVDAETKVRYYSGGWHDLARVVDVQFDIILSAETVYADRQAEPLADCVLQLLSDKGVALIAGKSYYFGVGGGMRAFEKAVRKAAQRLGARVEIKVVHEVRDGASNVREILQVRKLPLAAAPG